MLKPILVDAVAWNVSLNVLTQAPSRAGSPGFEQGGQILLQRLNLANALSEIGLEHGAFLGAVFLELI
ncbi:MAG: hypothetical protein CMC97_01245 [Flavobacteriales bacterium]|nr:hypothetical protein [Flavobacteriales bacterium]